MLPIPTLFITILTTMDLCSNNLLHLEKCSSWPDLWSLLLLSTIHYALRFSSVDTVFVCFGRPKYVIPYLATTSPLVLPFSKLPTMLPTFSAVIVAVHMHLHLFLPTQPISLCFIFCLFSKKWHMSFLKVCLLSGTNSHT